MSYSELEDLVSNSPLFDREWYENSYPDVKLANLDALEHFLVIGWRLGRNPSPRFDCRLYLELHPDVAQANINPLVHYLLYGQHEGRILQRTPMPNLPSPDTFIDFVEQQLALPTHTPEWQLGSEQKLRFTQQQLEHYFLRCQALEHELRQLKQASA